MVGINNHSPMIQPEKADLNYIGTCKNLAPFSYTQMVNHDPPVFVVGFSSSIAQAKDSLRNLLESGECELVPILSYFLISTTIRRN